MIFLTVSDRSFLRLTDDLPAPHFYDLFPHLLMQFLSLKRAIAVNRIHVHVGMDKKKWATKPFGKPFGNSLTQVAMFLKTYFCIESHKFSILQF